MSPKPDYLVLINEANRLPDGFENTIEIIDVENAVGEKYQIEKKTYEAFLRLREDLLQNDGIQTELISVYRTVEKQEEIFQRYTREHGLEYAKNTLPCRVIPSITPALPSMWAFCWAASSATL